MTGNISSDNVAPPTTSSTTSATTSGDRCTSSCGDAKPLATKTSCHHDQSSASASLSSPLVKSDGSNRDDILMLQDGLFTVTPVIDNEIVSAANNQSQSRPHHLGPIQDLRDLHDVANGDPVCQDTSSCNDTGVITAVHHHEQQQAPSITDQKHNSCTIDRQEQAARNRQPIAQAPQGSRDGSEGGTDQDNQLYSSKEEHDQFSCKLTKLTNRPSQSLTITTSTITTATAATRTTIRKRVRFSHVHVRYYKTTIGDNPSVSFGPPLSLDWDYESDENSDDHIQELTCYENQQQHAASYHFRTRKSSSFMILSATQRCSRLFQAGYSTEEVKQAMDELKRDKARRRQWGDLELVPSLQEFWWFHVEPLLGTARQGDKRHQKQLQKLEQQVREEHLSQHSSCALSAAASLINDNHSSSHLPSDYLFENASHQLDDLEANHGLAHSNAAARQELQHSVVIEGMDGLLRDEEHSQSTKNSTTRKSNSKSKKSSSPTSSKHRDSSESNRKGGSSDDNAHNGGDDDSDDENSSSDDETSYGIQVDRKQHDKAMEIILCSLKRPHMRAFHASWCSFFVAFFGWFAITPLLSEIKLSLQLDNKDIWISSLFGTAGTALMRICMGPLCDVFGARICMAFILIMGAIPTALTGLVQTSTGLFLVRLFIGIGGSSFVACQYWTSDMFTREVAGTANALVAGWGNLGGGVTQLVMGSALFPLFRLFYETDNFDDDEVVMDGNSTVDNGNNMSSDSSEMAWRTVFVVPAILSVVTALVILFYCDDSPTGSYKDRIRSETLLVASPMSSLLRAAHNRNVWILALQYACCFGVEVTMTNATALYFKDEFGQSTVSAAGIASIFGFMNIFARGMGGLGSDLMQHRYGLRGRLAWQTTTLILEGVGVGLFAYAESMAGSIIALIFLSCTVSSAEGSTFGIVPYVDRRFTGSVVGLVGSGGSIGGAMFSIFFVYFRYRAAFVLMGVSAVLSAFLCLFLNTAQMHEAALLFFDAEHLLDELNEGESHARVSTGIDARAGDGSVGVLPTTEAALTCTS